MDSKDIIAKLTSLANPKNAEGMARFGINPEKTLGIKVPVLRNMGKEIGRNQEMALELWESGIHEARMLAIFISEPKKVTAKMADRLVSDFNSWDICDQACSNLFTRTSFAWEKAFEWCAKEEEFVKRAGYVMMCTLAVHDKKTPDGKFLEFFPEIIRGADDERNFVKKAVNWAVRQIGKRSLMLNKEAIRLAEEILAAHPNSKAARWTASDALRELKSEAVRKRLEEKDRKRQSHK